MALEKINLGEYPTGKGGDNQRIASEKFNKAVDALGQEATTTQKGVVQLDNTLNSDSVSLALTAAMGKKLNDEKLAKTDVINTLNSSTINTPLSAAMGKKLQDEKLGKKENAASASVLETPRMVQFYGAATGSFSYDGSSNSVTALMLTNSGVTASTYGSTLKIPVLTINAKGLITVATTQDIPVFNGSTSVGLVPARIGSTSDKFLNENGTWSTTPNTTYSGISEAMMQSGTSVENQLITAKLLKQAVEFWGKGVARTYKDLVVQEGTAYKNNHPHDIWVSVFVELVSSNSWSRLAIADSPTGVFKMISAIENGGGAAARIECLQAWIPSGKTWRISFSSRGVAIANPSFYTSQEYS